MKKQLGNIRDIVGKKEVEEAVYQSLLVSGQLLPSTPREQEFVEKFGNLTDETLPTEISSFRQFEEQFRNMSAKRKFALRDDVWSFTNLEKIARAARKAGLIDSSTEDKMLEARERAKKKD